MRGMGRPNADESGDPKNDAWGTKLQTPGSSAAMEQLRSRSLDALERARRAVRDLDALSAEVQASANMQEAGLADFEEEVHAIAVAADRSERVLAQALSAQDRRFANPRTERGREGESEPDQIGMSVINFTDGMALPDPSDDERDMRDTSRTSTQIRGRDRPPARIATAIAIVGVTGFVSAFVVFNQGDRHA